MIQLKEQVIDTTGRGLRAILGLDLKKAFDRVKHTAILDRIVQLGLGERTYNFIRNFLTGRTARIRLDEEESIQVDMGSAGTPQGSVVSPMLFNLVMIGLSEKLDRIEGINHTVYADDITIWTTKDASEGDMENRLQGAVEAIENHLEGTGLECSPEKSELLLYRPRRFGKPSRDVAELHKRGIRLTTRKGTEIPMVQKIRVLGLWIEARGTNTETITRLEKKVTAAIRLIQRVSNNRRALKKETSYGSFRPSRSATSRTWRHSSTGTRPRKTGSTRSLEKRTEQHWVSPIHKKRKVTTTRGA